MNEKAIPKLSPKLIRIAIGAGAVFLLLIVTAILGGIRDKKKSSAGPANWSDETFGTEVIFDENPFRPEELSQTNSEQSPLPSTSSSEPFSPQEKPPTPIKDDSSNSTEVAHEAPTPDSRQQAPNDSSLSNLSRKQTTLQFKTAADLNTSENPTRLKAPPSQKTDPSPPLLAENEENTTSSSSPTTHPASHTKSPNQERAIPPQESSKHSSSLVEQVDSSRPKNHSDSESNISRDRAQLTEHEEPSPLPQKMAPTDPSPQSALPQESSAPPAPSKTKKSELTHTNSISPAPTLEMEPLQVKHATTLIKASRSLISVENFNQFLHAHDEPLRLPGDSNDAFASWTEAMAFTAWLTEQHRNARLISSDTHYRLPRKKESPAKDIWKFEDRNQDQSNRKRFGLVLSKGKKP